MEALKTQKFIRVSKSTRAQKYFWRRNPESSYALASWNLHSEFCTQCTKSFVWAFSVNPSIFSVTHLRGFSFLVNFGKIMLPNVAILFKRRIGLNSLNFRVIGIGVIACTKKWRRLVSTTSVRKMYEGNNTTSSKLTMLQLKEHEQQQDNCSLIHMFWYHMLQLYSLRMRFFHAPRDLLGQRKCTFVGWVGGSGKRGEESGACKAGVCGGGGGCETALSEDRFRIFLYQSFVFHLIFFFFLFIFIFSFFLSFVHYCFFLSRGYLLLQRLCLLYIRSLNKFQSLRFPALLHSRFECRHATSLPPCGEDRCVTTLKTDV